MQRRYRLRHGRALQRDVRRKQSQRVCYLGWVMGTVLSAAVVARICSSVVMALVLFLSPIHRMNATKALQKPVFTEIV